MTSITPRPKSKMTELGEVLRYHRLAAGYTPRQVGDFCGASSKLYEQWEAGELAPDNQRWSKMVIQNRQLQRYRPLWSEALAEQAERDRAKPLATKLGDKLASLTIVPPAPAAEVLPEPMPTPAPTLDERLREAASDNPEPKHPIFNVKNLPAGWRLPENVAAREEYARQMVRDNGLVSADEVREAQRAKFGVATDQRRIREVIADELTKISKATKRQASKELRDSDPYAAQRAQERKEAKASRSAAVNAATSVDDNVSAATELLLEAIPNLASFELMVAEDGQATVSYKTREVKVVETTGTIKIGGKK